jgi:hypothetical protein
VLAFTREPPQKWDPESWTLTMKGRSPEEAATPPTMSSEFSSQLSGKVWGRAAPAMRAGRAAKATRRVLAIMLARLESERLGGL